MKNTYRRPIIIITFAILLYSAVQNVNAVWQALVAIYACFEPIVGGLVIAFMLNVPVVFFEKKVFGRLVKRFPKKGKLACRALSLILSIILVVSIVLSISWIILPELIGAITVVLEKLPSTVNGFLAWIDRMCLEWNIPAESVPNIRIDWQSVSATVMDFLRTETSSVFDAATMVTASVFGGVFSFVMMLVISIYTVMQKEKIGSFLRRVVRAILPEHASERVLRVSGMTFSTFYNFITGQVVEAIILGVLCFIGMLIFRFPYAPVVSVVIGLGALVPILGAWIGGLAGALLILTVDPWQAFWFVVFLLTLQQLEGNIIYPRVVGRSIGVPGLLVMCAVSLGGNIGGVVGTLLSVPICSVLYVLLKEFVSFRHTRAHRSVPAE